MATFLEALKDMQENGAEYTCSTYDKRYTFMNGRFVTVDANLEPEVPPCRATFLCVSDACDAVWTKVEKLYDFAAAKEHLENGGVATREGRKWYQVGTTQLVFTMADINAKDWKLL